MEIKRFFANLTDIDNDFITLRGSEFYHATKVLRHKVGFKIIVCADEHNDIYATVTEIGKDCLTARIDKIVENDAETKKQITLYQCVAKEMDIIVQKAVELGVKRIVPVFSRYINSELNTERLHKIIAESSKQCGRPALMRLEEPLNFEDALLKACKEEQVLIFAYENATEGKIDSALSAEDNIGIFIGNEGGFSEGEAKALQDAGAKTITLGKRILRAETAAIATVALVMEKAGEMQ